MIETTDDLFSADIFTDEVIEQIKNDPKIIFEKLKVNLKEKLGLTVEDLLEPLCKAVGERAEEVVLSLPNIAPYGDYGAMIEDNDGMAEFVKKEAVKPETWALHSIMDDSSNKTLLKFTFKNKCVDDGEVLQGLVFVSKSGKIRHAFAQVDV